MIILCSNAHSQFLLDNPDFDTSLAGWTLDNAPTPIWTDLDIDDSQSSGSALIINSEADASTDVEILRQCIPHPQPGMHLIGLAANIPSGQATSGSVVMRFNRHNTDDCSGGYNASSGYFVAQSNITDRWVGVMQENMVSNFTNSMEFIVAIRKTEAGGLFLAHVDAAILENIDSIFFDDFE